MLGIFVCILILYFGTGLVKNIIDIFRFFTEKDDEEIEIKPKKLIEKSERR